MGVYGWRFGPQGDRVWQPVAIIPNTPGSNQAGRMQASPLNNEYLFLSVGAQAEYAINGVYALQYPYDFYGDQSVRQVYDQQHNTNNFYGWYIMFDETTGTPEYMYTARKNVTSTDYSLDLSQLVRVDWVGDAATGVFAENTTVELDDIYHRGHCIFGCAIWTVLAINVDEQVTCAT